MYISVHLRLFQFNLLETKDLYYLNYKMTKIFYMINVVSAEHISSFHKPEKSK